MLWTVTNTTVVISQDLLKLTGKAGKWNQCCKKPENNPDDVEYLGKLRCYCLKQSTVINNNVNKGLDTI